MGKYSAIIDYIRKEDVALFIGAGCSLQSGAPTAKQLSEQLYEALSDNVKGDQNLVPSILQNVSDAVILDNNGNREVINNTILEQFTGLQPNDFHKNLVKVPHIRSIITTNYDTLVEDAYYSGMCQVFCTDEDCRNFQTNKVHIYKIHGDVNNLDKVIISDTDYRKFLDSPSDPILWAKIQSEFAVKTIVFVGYSVEDWNVLNLVEKVIERIGNNSKKRFIISPSIGVIQSQRLRKLGITHISGTAEEFITSTIQEIKDKFGIDKENNACSQDTLGKFAALNGIIMSLENDGLHTSITSMRAKYGTLLHQFHFNTKDKDFLTSRFTQTSTEIIKGFQVPLKCLNADEMKTFDYRVNGIRINGLYDYSQVLIGPAITEEKVTFQSLKAGFQLQHTIKRYGTGEECHICVDGEICLIEYIFHVNRDDSNSFSGTININLKETFSNLHSALQWADLLIALVDNDDFFIRFSKVKLPMISISDREMSRVYHNVKSYLENLREIELAGGFFFERYERYSPDALMASKMVKAFLRKEAFIDVPREGLAHLSINVGKGKFDKKPGDYLVRIVTKMNGKVVLNSKEFDIEEERALLKKCAIHSVDETHTDYDVLSIDNLDNEVQYEYVRAGEPDLLIDGKVES